MTIQKAAVKDKKNQQKKRKNTVLPAKKKWKAVEDIAPQALRIHKALRGKISVVPKAKVSNKVDLSVYYTPGVGAVSSFLAKNKEKTREYTMKSNMVAVVSDGSAVLGLGNIGPEAALPVMEGKAMLFKALGGVDAFPLVLATQDTEAIIATVKNIAPGFGGINLEDIAAPRCFEIESRLKAELDIPVMHDDQHGTALVVVAGLINALKVVKKHPHQIRIVIAGAGAAGQAIAKLLLLFGVGDILMVDSKGILSPIRLDLDRHKLEMVKLTNKENRSGTLQDAFVSSDVFIGVSRGGTVKKDDIARMSQSPIVFSLANPIPEIMPEEAKAGGAAVIATGRSDFENQINNSLGFPGIFRGALDHGVRDITDNMLLAAAKKLAALVSRPTAKQIIPSTFDPRVAKAVASAIR
ncbi:MAG: NADP-dependent malic enzyme [Candidatus Moranbacteria bacterium]|nr:NADP-dependent malic enzyme [Candidatus Moranbacteria bacterium]MBP9801878.1 NADP-dependent malic enzyme [Candidatus Moranbacteria bacterium]